MKSEKRTILWHLLYITFIDHDLDIDYEAEMSRIQSELKELMIEERQSQFEIEAALEGIGYGIK